MAMTANGLRDAIKTEIENQFGTADDATQLTDYATAMGTAIVNYIQNNAVVAMSGNGADTNGDTLVTNTGTVS